MTGYDAFNLVSLCVENGILQEQDGGIFIYRTSGSDPSEFPEGWYLEDKTSVCQELMEDTEGTEFLVKELANKGIKFEEKGAQIIASIDKILDAIDDKIHFEERQQGEYWAV